MYEVNYRTTVERRVIRPLLAIARTALRDEPVHLLDCLSLSLMPKCVHKTRFFSKAKQFRAMVTIDDL